ncbi:hypothetical protein [Mobiluncus mulieris]|uniref:Uncharacterized protein n=1 Tax=Mobiluncus mulieris TaxID=2052 RepID=A0A378PG01_9ACTO|nr:hypothetical protein [Mobiluncus mulieris]NMW65478.1 hypothetical protein [Mobiluncus mulieris]NMX01972.1 hypothetical protein [Mobiluncus mulieris]NMX20448.1 hypothetical protein [Mobiluncus mulieris]STY85112.1 Uncharacterised protein [Mobiluncus mulieris]
MSVAVDDKAAVVAVEDAAGELRREFFDDEVLDRLLDATSERAALSW